MKNTYFLLEEPGRFHLVEEELAVKPGHLLVRLRRCGVCTGELMDWYVARKVPYTPGHEIVGEVIRAPSDSPFNEGDTVFVHHHAPCMECDYCMRGEYTSCPVWRSSRIYPGGLSRYILVPPEIYNVDTFVVPSDVSLDDAALIEPLGCSVKAIRKARITSLDDVAVIGLGFMGLLNAKLSSLYARSVVGFDLLENRRRICLDGWGCDEAYHPDEYDASRRFQVVVVGPPFEEAIRFALRIADRGSRVVLFAPLPPGQHVSFEIFGLYFNEISIIPSYSAGPDDTRMALRYIQSGRVRPSLLITHRFPFDRTPEAYRTAHNNPDAIKVMIDIEP